MSLEAMDVLCRLVSVLCVVPPGAAAAPGTITTVAGTGRSELGAEAGAALEVPIAEPFGLEVGPGGSLYICEVGHHRVLRLDPRTGRVETVAGCGRKGHTGD